MELAIILVVLVIVELVLSVFVFARLRDYLHRLTILEDILLANSEPVNVDKSDDKDISKLVANATPEDMQQAAQIIKALGLDKVDKNA